MKSTIKAVRTFLIKDTKVLAIKYITLNDVLDYYDIPGGKIEKETSEQASIREFKEESKMEIYNPSYRGKLFIEYPDKIFDIDVYTASDYKGTPQATEKNVSEWISIQELLQKEKRLTTTYLLDENHIKDLLYKTNFQLHFIVDSDHKLIKEK